MTGRSEALQLAFFWLALMAIYWSTMPPDITFEDTPLFAGACATLGLPHPPGYPAHVLFCAPFTQALHALGFPLARGAAFASAFDAASACAMLAWLLTRMFGSRPASYLAAGLLALSPPLWSQAVIPEVYALNLWIVIGTMAGVHFYASGGTRRWLVYLAAVTGLGLANHWPLYALTYPAFLIWLAPHWRRVLRDLATQKTIAWCLLAFGAGLSPYIHLLTVSPDSFKFAGDYEADDFLAYIRRDVYGLGGNVLGTNARIAVVANAAVSFVAAFQYAFALFFAAGIAFLVSKKNWLLLAAVLWGMLATTSLLALVRPYENTSGLSTWIFSVYPIQSYAFAAVPLALGFALALRRLRTSEGLSHVLVAGVLIAVAAYWWPKQDRSNENIALPYARLLLESVPDDGLLILQHNDFSFPFRYAAYFNGGRALPERVTENDYFDELRSDGTMTAGDEEKLLAENRTVAYTLKFLPETFGHRFHGLHSTVATDLKPDEVEVDISPEAREILADVFKLAEKGARNVFTKVFVESIVIFYVTEMLEAQRTGAKISLEDQVLLSTALLTPEGRYGQFFHHALNPNKDLGLKEVTALFRDIEPFLSGLRPERRSDVLHLYATALIFSGDLAGGYRVLEATLRDFPSDSNAKVIVDLLQIHDGRGDFESYRSLRRRFPGADVGTALAESDLRCAEHFGEPCAISLDD